MVILAVALLFVSTGEDTLIPESPQVLFVFPPAHGNAGRFRSHLGVGYLRAALQRAGISTAQHLDEQPGSIERVAAAVLERGPRIVGFTVYDANFLLAVALAKHLKHARPELPILFGGPTATFCAAEILKRYPVVDACVRGEAEESGPPIFGALLRGDPIAGLPGVVCRSAGEIVSGPLPPLAGCTGAPTALDASPSPYLSGIFTDGKMGVLTGRGCTHHCQYCAFAALGRRRLRLHSVDRVLADLTFIAEQQHRSGSREVVSIHDDAFTLLPTRAKELCQAIIDRKLNLLLSCITRADAVDDELLRLMRAAGFLSMAFGLESAVPSVLRATGKVRPPDWPDANLEPERRFLRRIRSSVVAAKRHDFNVGVSIILGLPTETRADGEATLRFVRSLPVDYYMHNFLWVFPGTPLWETHGRYGIGCETSDTGLPVTTEYAYDLTGLRPARRCALENDARLCRLLAVEGYAACDVATAGQNHLGTALLSTRHLPREVAAWLSDVLGVGGLVLQRYPELPRSDRAVRLFRDRAALMDGQVPVRHHLQLLPHRDAHGERRLLVSCAGIDLYCRHRPDLVSLRVSRSAGPLVRWAGGGVAGRDVCDATGLLPRPSALERIAAEAGPRGLGPAIRSRPVPPALTYPGRWLPGTAPCRRLTRVEVDDAGAVRTCVHGDPIGRVGDSPSKLRARLARAAAAAERRRGCARCGVEGCPRCPFPGIPEAAYCQIMTERQSALATLQWVHLYSRLPLLLEQQRDNAGSS